MYWYFALVLISLVIFKFLFVKKAILHEIIVHLLEQIELKYLILILFTRKVIQITSIIVKIKVLVRCKGNIIKHIESIWHISLLIFYIPIIIINLRAFFINSFLVFLSILIVLLMELVLCSFFVFVNIKVSIVKRVQCKFMVSFIKPLLKFLIRISFYSHLDF